MTEFLTLLLPLWPWGPISWITDLFIYGIVLCALVSAIRFWTKIHLRTRMLEDLIQELRNFKRPAQPQIKQELKGRFDRNDELAEAWQEFEDSLITRQRDENLEVVYKTEEASFFFSEDRLLGQYLNLRFWNSVPALLVGLGILGTFVGLVWGLIPFSGIDFTQTDQIQSAIKKLLAGVSTAFVTSVWGMLTSLLFNGLEKWRIGRVSRAISNLQRALDQLFTLTTQEEISFRQEDELAQQTAALKSFSTDLADRIKIAMHNIMSERLENLHQGLTQLRDQNAQGGQEIIQELHNAPGAFSHAVAEQLAPSLVSLNTAVEELRQHKEESSADAIGKLIKEFQDSLSTSTVTQMEELARTVGAASQSLMTLPNQMQEMIAGVQNQIDQTSQLLSETSQEQMGQTKQMLSGMLNAFQSAINAQQAGLSETTDRVNEEMKQIAADVRNLLESVTARTDQQLAQRMMDFESTIDRQQKTINAITSQMAAESAKATDQMTNQVEQTATRLGESIQDAEQSVGRIFQLLEPQIKAFDKQINDSRDMYAKGCEMLQQMDASATSIRQLIETTKSFSGQLVTGANQLERAGQHLTQTSDAFNRENEKFLSANRETTQQMQKTLDQSSRVLEDFAHRFGTINEGLNGIFAEIEKGLTTYATTSRESISRYLGDFSNQLSSAANALAGTIEALGDNVEILNDMAERQR